MNFSLNIDLVIKCTPTNNDQLSLPLTCRLFCFRFTCTEAKRVPITTRILQLFIILQSKLCPYFGIMFDKSNISLDTSTFSDTMHSFQQKRSSSCSSYLLLLCLFQSCFDCLCYFLTILSVVIRNCYQNTVLEV